MSFQSCALDFFFNSDLVSWLPVWKLDMLAESSIVLAGAEGYSELAASEGPALLASFSARCRCNSLVMSSTGRALMISSRMVGSKANTV
jgi:hypothetical protein